MPPSSVAFAVDLGCHSMFSHGRITRREALNEARWEARAILSPRLPAEPLSTEDAAAFMAAERIRAGISFHVWREAQPYTGYRRYPRVLERLLEGNLSNRERAAVARFVEGWSTSGPRTTTEIDAACRALLGE